MSVWEMSLQRLPKRQVDTRLTQQRMLPRLEWRNAVEHQPRFPAPDHHIAVQQWHFQRLVTALQTAPQKRRGQTQRHRHNRRGQITFIAILMQCHFCAHRIAVDQASIRLESGETCRECCGLRQGAEIRWQRRPRLPTQRVGGAVAVAFAVGDPARRAAIGHRHRHRIAAGGLHVPERGLGSNGVDACQQAVGVDGGVLAQYQRTGA